jgi:hypothetical protein
MNDLVKVKYVIGYFRITQLKSQIVVTITLMGAFHNLKIRGRVKNFPA